MQESKNQIPARKQYLCLENNNGEILNIKKHLELRDGYEKKISKYKEFLTVFFLSFLKNAHSL